MDAYPMKKIFKYTLFSSLVWAGLSCSSGTSVDVDVTEIENGSLVVRRLSDNKIVHSEGFGSSENLSFTRAEAYLGGSDLKLQILDSDGNEAWAAVVSKNFDQKLINVNAVTTLASCLFETYQKSSSFDPSKISDWIDEANSAVQGHFALDDAISSKPQTTYDGVESLSSELKYGLVLETFKNLALDYGESVTAFELVENLCDDLTFDGYLNGIGSEGVLELDERRISDQTLKAEFAGELYRTFIDQLPTLAKENIFSQANTISVDENKDLFDPNVKSYFFENERPEDIVWLNGNGPPSPGDDFIVEFTIEDQLNSPVTIEVNVTFTASENTYELMNDLPSQNYFIADDIPFKLPNDGPGTMYISGTDVFGNSRKWAYLIEY